MLKVTTESSEEDCVAVGSAACSLAMTGMFYMYEGYPMRGESIVLECMQDRNVGDIQDAELWRGRMNCRGKKYTEIW